MKRTLPALVGLCLVTAGCGDSTSKNAADAAPSNVANAAQTNAADSARKPGGRPALMLSVSTSDKTTSELLATVVRDHPQGAEVATGASRGTVFTHVEETPVRNAAHFRELVDAASKSGRTPKVNMNLYCRDVGEGWCSMDADYPAAKE